MTASQKEHNKVNPQISQSPVNNNDEIKKDQQHQQHQQQQQQQHQQQQQQQPQNQLDQQQNQLLEQQGDLQGDLQYDQQHQNAVNLANFNTFVEPSKQMFRKYKRMVKIIFGISLFILVLMTILSIVVICLSITEGKKVKELRNHDISEWNRIPCTLCFRGEHYDSYKYRFRITSGFKEYDKLQCELQLKSKWKCHDFKLNDDDEPDITDKDNYYYCIPNPNLSDNFFPSNKSSLN